MGIRIEVTNLISLFFNYLPWNKVIRLRKFLVNVLH
jgi:hypothetical protein